MASLAVNLLDRGVSEILRWLLKSIPRTKWTYSLPNSIAPYKGYKNINTISNQDAGWSGD